MKSLISICCFFWFGVVSSDDSYASYEPLVACDEEYIPENCGYPNITLDKMITLEDFDRCGPAVLPIAVRNFIWSAAGRKRTYSNNYESLRKIRIIPRMLHDVSNNDLYTTVLGKTIRFPVGISPSSAHKMVNPVGEAGTASAAASLGSVMILSMTSQTTLEDVAKAAFSVNPNATLWMETLIFKNRDEMVQLVRRAEKVGFSAIVVLVDCPILTTSSCNSRDLLNHYRQVNLYEGDFDSKIDASLTFRDLTRLTRATKLPVVAKGIMTAADAIKAAKAGVAAVLVSNHGGRQLDYERATIDVLPEVANALRLRFPKVEVYVDGGIRNGWDVLKALIRGAKATFVGRPALWGLAMGGEEGVKKVLTILRTEFNESMITAGYANPREISQQNRIWPIPIFPINSVIAAVAGSANENISRNLTDDAQETLSEGY